MRKLVYKAKICPDGTLLESMSKYDYRQHKDKNGRVYIIDGGLDLISNSDPYQDSILLCVWTNDPFERVRSWGYRFCSNSREYVKIKDIDDEWLENILKYYVPLALDRFSSGKMDDDYLLIYIQEKLYRAEQEYEENK